MGDEIGDDRKKLEDSSKHWDFMDGETVVQDRLRRACQLMKSALTKVENITENQKILSFVKQKLDKLKDYLNEHGELEFESYSFNTKSKYERCIKDIKDTLIEAMRLFSSTTVLPRGLSSPEKTQEYKVAKPQFDQLMKLQLFKIESEVVNTILNGSEAEFEELSLGQESKALNRNAPRPFLGWLCNFVEPTEQREITQPGGH